MRSALLSGLLVLLCALLWAPCAALAEEEVGFSELQAWDRVRVELVRGGVFEGSVLEFDDTRLVLQRMDEPLALQRALIATIWLLDRPAGVTTITPDDDGVLRRYRLRPRGRSFGAGFLSLLLPGTGQAIAGQLPIVPLFAGLAIGLDALTIAVALLQPENRNALISIVILHGLLRGGAMVDAFMAARDKVPVTAWLTPLPARGGGGLAFGLGARF